MNVSNSADLVVMSKPYHNANYFQLFAAMYSIFILINYFTYSVLICVDFKAEKYLMASSVVYRYYD